jgi:hypothetical protein
MRQIYQFKEYGQQVKVVEKLTDGTYRVRGKRATAGEAVDELAKIAIYHACSSFSKEKAIEIVESEEELDGPMPDDIWDRVKGSKEEAEVALRSAVIATKKSIARRIREQI